MTSENLYFIQPHVLERLVSGQFVARRQQSKTYRMRDRRDNLSPLNVTRRAIRYEPQVFFNRKKELIQGVHALNNPQTKLFLVSGPSGRGKTCYVRGVIEMMGGGKEQLLWFDVSRHTDFDEVVRFLVEYMTVVCRNAQEAQTIPEGQNPAATLELLLRQAEDFPILIVIDNMEHLVAPDQTLRSRELKEAFNFLLGFPNVKLILAGKQLPLADMAPSSVAVHHIELVPLSLEKSDEVVKTLFKNPHHKDFDLSLLLPFLQGEPYLLFLFSKLFERHPHIESWFHAFQHQPDNPKQVLVNELYGRLSVNEQQIVGILSLVRHGLTPTGLQELIRHCEPALLEAFDFKHLDHSLIRLVLKKVYPPQMVLNKLRNRNGDEDGQDAIEAYYQLTEVLQAIVYQSVPEEDKAHIHFQLQQFYMDEKNKHVLERIYHARTRHLVAEAQYHATRAKKRRIPTVPKVILSQSLTSESPVTSVERPLFSVEPPDLSKSATGPKRYETSSLPWPANVGEETEITLASATGNTPAAEIPWPNLSREEKSLLSDQEVALVKSQEPVSMIIASQVPVQRIPISIQVEPSATVSPTVRFTEEDLQKLADLISRGESRTRSGNYYEALEDDMSTESRNREKAELEKPSVTADPEEQQIQARINQAILHHQRGDIARELLHLGQVRADKGYFDNAEKCLLKALDFAKEASLVPLEMEAHGALGSLYREHYLHNKALRHLREVEHLLESHPEGLGNNDTLVQAYRDMAEIYAYRKDDNEALSLFGKCLALSPGDSKMKADILLKMALTLDEAEHLEEAIGYYQKSVEVNQALKDDTGCAAALYNLGSLYLELSRFAESEATFLQCLIYDKRSGTDTEVFRTLMQLSRIGEAMKDMAEAKSHAQQALQVAQQASDITNVASACLRLGHLCEQAYIWPQASQYYRKALSVARDELSTESRQMILEKLAFIEEHHS